MNPPLRFTAFALSSCILGGCATGPTADPRDPLEPFNRSMTSFNEAVDKAVLKPVATAYTDVLPSPVRTGVNNFFGNLGDAWSFVNNVLQLRGEQALNSLVRFNVNTFFGFGGVLDIASEMRIERSKQDFGLTLARWGVPSGPYLVLPFLGPSTVRDTAGLPADWYGDLARQVDPVSDRNMLYALRIVDTRASLLNAGDVIEGAALDKYTFTRDAYLQMRAKRAQKTGADEGSSDEGRLPPEPEE
ncbi:MlaA family lipoprotein [Extensimonas vulgaris]|uniref:Phospholipid-binding lipoprotein MlaA n=1 Tax=Extensimonas vulgaris TaxID=1031594 RepID=A0A369AI39_9BURK|nr:VacJ family lipoprotein [Extensimonas vulgaris]RCX07817.1 phospholipid-binding lipoprotein MlaA [Extensimonas vulgaris]TWI35611.1 phospholipid-binding lipoprotein MlaA [Extensimonas vulgaris]TXD13235.1 VacJ family lipoprotein [Extensimonas vulgaris]